MTTYPLIENVKVLQYKFEIRTFHLVVKNEHKQGTLSKIRQYLAVCLQI